MKVSASIHSELNLHQVRVETNCSSKQLTIAPKPDGSGSSINGAELLLLSVATCFCNDIYREAAKRGISIQGIDVEATGQFAAEKEPGSNFQYKAHVRSTAPAEEIEALIKYVDEIAEIHQTLRKGIAVKLIANHD